MALPLNRDDEKAEKTISPTHPMTFQPSNPQFLEDIKGSFAQQSIMQLIGAALGAVGPGTVEIVLPYRADLGQQNGYLHAGIVTTIADSAAGYAAYSLMPAGSGVLSVEFKVNLLRPARGKSFVARAEVLKPGRTLTVVRADVFGKEETGAEELVATMLATMFCTRKQNAL
ncbi:MAG TPA: PaaI family thioesterase [Pyrinomonadaceae bacterium]|nr:PaaI family thioesterase [Pyrinomonadaceae bacterium]